VQGVLPAGCRCIYIRQAEPLGLGHAVLCAQPVVGNEPFAVVLADDLIDANPPVLAQMAQKFSKENCSILGVEEIERAHTASYGIVSPERAGAELSAIRAIVEKPLPERAPSTLAVVGRYVLTPGVFGKLAAVKPGSGGEIQLTDAISALLAEERVMAYRFSGRRYDCGSKLGYLQATVELGARHAEVGAQFARYLAGRRDA
jgi:UTP--glucose-1-phosphate uridylyltransferase